MTNEKLDKLAKVIRKYSVRVSAPYPDDDCFYYLTTENQLKKSGINIGTYKKYFYVDLNKVYNYPYDKSLLWHNSEFLNSISKKFPCLSIFVFMNNGNMFKITDDGMYKYKSGKEIICKYIWCEDFENAVEELDALIESPTSLKEFYNNPRPRLTHIKQKKLHALVEKLDDCSIKADKKLNILGYKIKRPFYYYVTTFNYLKRRGFDIDYKDGYLTLGRGPRVDDIYYLMYVEFSKKAIGKEVLIVMKNKIENVGRGIYTWKPPFSPSQSSLLKAALKIFDKLAIKYNDNIEKAFEEYNESMKKK